MRNLFRKQPPLTTVPAQARPGSAKPGSQADGLWVRCENEHCHELLYTREFEQNLKVCPKCDHHARLTARERIEQLVDEGTFRECDTELQPGDPLSFVASGTAYADKLVEAQQKTSMTEAAIGGEASLNFAPVQLVVLDFAFIGGSMSTVVGEKIVRAAERAYERKSPLITVSTGAGARQQEGILALMQMAKTVSALAPLARAGLPHFSILTDNTLGGITASYAGMADIIIAEQGARIGFAGPRVIEQTTKQKLPPDAQRAAFLLEHGMVDMVLSRRELRPTLMRLVKLYGGSKAAADVSPNGALANAG